MWCGGVRCAIIVLCLDHTSIQVSIEIYDNTTK